MTQPDYRLTEKKMSDARFRRTEEAILDVIYENGLNLSTNQIVKKAGLSKSTFYLHHKTVHAIISDSKQFILRKYIRRIHGQKQIKRLYTTTLFFILGHKQLFIFLTEHGDRELIIAMLHQLDHHVETATRLPKNSGKILRIHSGSVCELIIDWCKNGMPESDINRLLSEAMFLTTTMRTRLTPLLK